MSVPSELVTEWLTKAAQDAAAGQQLVDANNPAPACFHFQQAAEKLLKALLVHAKQPVPKIHDLVALATLVQPYADMAHVRNELELLDRYYIETRYPGDFPDISAAESIQAADAALAVLSFVREQIDRPHR